MSYDLDTLSLGGGIVTVGTVDMGNCTEFSIQINLEKDIKTKYFSQGGSVIKIPVASNSTLTGVMLSGSFVCESLTEKSLQNLGFLSGTTGEFLSLLGVGIPTTNISFVSSPKVGRVFTFSCSDVFIEVTNPIRLLSLDDWNNISFSFTGLLDSLETSPPSLVLT